MKRVIIKSWIIFVGALVSCSGDDRVGSFNNLDNERILDEIGIPHLDSQQPGCPKFHNLKPIKDFKTVIGDWRVPYLSTTWLRLLSRSIHQVTKWKNSGLEKACVKLTILPMPNGKSATNSSLWIISKCPMTGATFDLECEPSDVINSEWVCGGMLSKKMDQFTKPDAFYLYIFHYEFIGTQYALVVKCFPKVGLNWAIITKEKVIVPQVIKRFMTKLKNMGINMTNIIELPYEKC